MCLAETKQNKETKKDKTKLTNKTPKPKQNRTHTPKNFPSHSRKILLGVSPFLFFLLIFSYNNPDSDIPEKSMCPENVIAE